MGGFFILNNMKDKFLIHGGKPLYGEVKIQASKNGTLPLISASILTSGEVKIKNYPKITDLTNMLKILKTLGVKTKTRGQDLIISSKKCKNKKIPVRLARRTRASLFFLGSMLNRFKECYLPLPGGCKIGARPIDVHIKALKKLKVKVKSAGKYLYFDARNSRAGKVKLKIPSVGATENLIQFACTLFGTTTILNSAKEPEIVELCEFLNKMGAKIEGAGTNKITIYGVSMLSGAEYTPQADRIVAGTYMIATAICGGKVTLYNAQIRQNKNLIDKLVSMGCKIDSDCDILTISSNGELINPAEISTGYYPAFPTDLQSMMLSACCVGRGKTRITENLFENRFLTAWELKKMGAKINQLNPHQIEVEGGALHGAVVEAHDLRGGASLVLAGLKADGVTIVKNVHFIDRGYQNLEADLKSLGADIKRI